MPTESRLGPKSNEQGKEVRVPCAECNRETTHAVVLSAEYANTYEDGDFSIQSWDDYQVVECKGCQAISFRRVSRNTEDFDHDPQTGQEFLHDKVDLYPHRLAGRRELTDSWYLPLPVQRVYGETLQALRAGMLVLAGIGIRALVETMCKDRGAEGSNLEQRLDSLVAQGVLTRDGVEILHSLRIMGNDAAHEVKPHTISDLSTAMDVIEHALSGIYILPKLAAKLPKRKAKKSAKVSMAKP